MTTPTPVLERARRGELAKAARREEILAAARHVFANRGFRGTTIADIAEEAGIALGTIYLYFSSKDDVFAALQEQLNELITAAVRDVTEGQSLAETVRLRVENVFATCGENRDLVRLVVLNTDPDSGVQARIRRAEELRNGPMVRTIRQAMDSGAIRRADPFIMTRLTFGLVSMAVYQAFVLSDGEDANKYRDECAEMILAYMTPAAVPARAG